MIADMGPSCNPEEMFNRLVFEYQEKLLHMCAMYLKDDAAAEDAVQETFLKAWRHYDRFRGEAGDKTWLMRIAMNTCKDQLKSAWFRNTDRSVTPDLLPEGSVPFEERDDTVTRAVMSLPPKLREVTLLRWYQGLSLEEMVQVMRVPRSTVNYRLKKAKTMLQGSLEEWYDEEE